jgi:hypothetical protein
MHDILSQTDLDPTNEEKLKKRTYNFCLGKEKLNERFKK